jgi:hypothetical protein
MTFFLFEVGGGDGFIRMKIWAQIKLNAASQHPKHTCFFGVLHTSNKEIDDDDGE